MALGLMAIVFVAGLYAGREQGLKQALDDHGQVAVRLPIDVGSVVASGAPAVQEPEPKPSAQPLISDMLTNAPGEEKKREGSAKTAPSSFLTKPAGTPETAKAKKEAAKPEEPETLGAKVKKAPPKTARKSTVAEVSVLAPVEAKKTSSVTTPPVTKVSAQRGLPLESQHSIASGWYIQLFSKRNAQSAKNLAEPFRKASYPVVLQQASVKGVRYHRVLVGPFANRRIAESKRKELRAKGKAPSGSYLRRIYE